MSELDNHEHIKSLGKKMTFDPPREAWNRIQHKLKKEKRDKKRKLYLGIRTWLSIAASISIIIASFTLIYIESQAPQKINKSYAVRLLDLEETDDYFYSIQNARKNNKIVNTIGKIQSDIDLNSLKGTSLLPIIFRDYPI